MLFKVLEDLYTRQRFANGKVTRSNLAKIVRENVNGYWRHVWARQTTQNQEPDQMPCSVGPGMCIWCIRRRRRQQESVRCSCAEQLAGIFRTIPYLSRPNLAFRLNKDGVWWLSTLKCCSFLSNTDAYHPKSQQSDPSGKPTECRYCSPILIFQCA